MLLGLQFQPLQAPHSSDIKAPLLVLVKGAASAISKRHSGANSEHYSAPILSAIQALIPASFRHSFQCHSSADLCRCKPPLRAPFRRCSSADAGACSECHSGTIASAIQELFKRRCRCLFRVPFRHHCKRHSGASQAPLQAPFSGVPEAPFEVLFWCRG